MIVSYDPGFGFIKAVSYDKKKFRKNIFPSLIDKTGSTPEIVKDKSSIAEILSSQEIEKYISFEFENIRYSVGNGASAEFSLDQFELLRPSQDLLLLFLANFALFSIKYSINSADFAYVVPVNLLNAEKERLVPLLLGEKSVKVHGIFEKEIKLKVNSVTFVEQGVSSLIDVMYQFDENGDVVLKNKLEGKTAVFDIGTNTLNVVIYENFKLIYKETHPKSGMYKFVEDFVQHAKEKGIVLSKADVQKMMIEQNFVISRISPTTFKQETIDFTDVANSLKEKVFNDILKPRISQVFSEFSVKNIVITGGGANVFKDLHSFIIPPDAQFSNALGALKLYKMKVENKI
ncbi:MAG: ParM/StbA family protein [Conexivisphaerales archaeon]